MSTHLIELARSYMVVRAKLQEELDKLVPPTASGYLHANESWTVAYVYPYGSGTGIEIGLDPPEHASDWTYPTAEKLQRLQVQLGCDHLSVIGIDAGEVRYRAFWEGTSR